MADYRKILLNEVPAEFLSDPKPNYKPFTSACSMSTQVSKRGCDARECQYNSDGKGMKRHIVTTHLRTEQAPFACRSCWRGYTTVSDMRSHLKGANLTIATNHPSYKMK